MKKLLSTCLAALVLVQGCTFFQQHQTALVTLSRTAAQLGTQTWLKSHPGDKPLFVASEAAITRFIDSGSSDPAAFAAALQGLPINELKGTNGSLYVSAVIVLWDELAAQATSVTQAAEVRAVALAVRDGIDAAVKLSN